MRGESGLTLLAGDQPCSSGKHNHNHPTVLFNEAAQRDQASVRQEDFSRP